MSSNPSLPVPVAGRPEQHAPAARPLPLLNPEETRQLFMGLVVADLEAGFLRYSRRKALLDYAAKLGIPEFEATLLIAQASTTPTRSPPSTSTPTSPSTTSPVPTPGPSPYASPSPWSPPSSSTSC